MRRLGLGMSCALLVWSAVAHGQPADANKGSGDAPVQEITPEEPTPPSPPVPPPSKPSPAPSATPGHLATMDELMIPTSLLRFSINFFGDTSFSVVSPGTPVSSFSIATLGLRLLGQLSPSIDALGELAFETTETGGPVADVEQLAMRWRHGPGMLEVGRFHLDIGYWNVAFHHGRWLQMTVERPHVIRFEDDGGLVPVHWVGASYTLGKKDAPIGAVFSVGNGRGNVVDDIRVHTDTNEAKAVMAKVRFKSGEGEFGFGAIYDLIAPANMMIRPLLPDRKIHELIGNMYFVNRGDRLTILSEGYVFRHQAGSQSWMTYGGFAQLGYRFGDIVTPYLAFDAIDGANKDPYFHPDPMMTENHDMAEGIAGIRLETSTWSALKLETHLEHPLHGGKNEYEGILNWSFGL